MVGCGCQMLLRASRWLPGLSRRYQGYNGNVVAACKAFGGVQVTRMGSRVTSRLSSRWA